MAAEGDVKTKTGLMKSMARALQNRSFYDDTSQFDTKEFQEIVQLLEDTYCRTVGVEYMHIQDRDRRRWLQKHMETTRNRPVAPPELKLEILRQLVPVLAVEHLPAGARVALRVEDQAVEVEEEGADRHGGAE